MKIDSVGFSCISTNRPNYTSGLGLNGLKAVTFDTEIVSLEGKTITNRFCYENLFHWYVNDLLLTKKNVFSTLNERVLKEYCWIVFWI